MNDAMGMLHQVKHPKHEQEWNDRQLVGTAVREPQIRVWTYTAPGLVFGCSQRALLTSSGANGPVALRSSGGGLVLTGPWMLSVSVILPLRHPLVTPGIVESYRWFGLAHEAALQEVGINVVALPPEQLSSVSVRPDLEWACFGNCSSWELVANRRKIVGLAQRRSRTGVLLTSGILMSEPDWSYLSKSLSYDMNSLNALAERTTSCRHELGRSLHPQSFLRMLMPKLVENVFSAKAFVNMEEEITT